MMACTSSWRTTRSSARRRAHRAAHREPDPAVELPAGPGRGPRHVLKLLVGVEHHHQRVARIAVQGLADAPVAPIRAPARPARRAPAAGPLRTARETARRPARRTRACSADSFRHCSSCRRMPGVARRERRRLLHRPDREIEIAAGVGDGAEQRRRLRERRRRTPAPSSRTRSPRRSGRAHRPPTPRRSAGSDRADCAQSPPGTARRRPVRVPLVERRPGLRRRQLLGAGATRAPKSWPGRRSTRAARRGRRARMPSAGQGVFLRGTVVRRGLAAEAAGDYGCGAGRVSVDSRFQLKAIRSESGAGNRTWELEVGSRKLTRSVCIRTRVPQGSCAVDTPSSRTPESRAVRGSARPPRRPPPTAAARSTTASRRPRRWRAARRPGVGPEVMVVAAGRHEQRAGVVPHHFVEAEAAVIEAAARSRSPTFRWRCPIVVPAGIPVHAPSPAAARRPRMSRRSVVMNSCRPWPSSSHRGRSA